VQRDATAGILYVFSREQFKAQGKRDKEDGASEVSEEV